VKSFYEAIEGMAKEGFITIDNQDIFPSNHFVNNVISKRTMKKVVNILEQSKASLYSYLMHGKAGLVDLDTISKELTFRTRKDLSKIIRKKHMKDPRDYLHLRVSNGTVCLNDKSSITEILKRMKPNANIEITPLTGVLNEVYLVKVDDEKIVAKKFTDWHSLKWFVLNIFALGTKTFYLSGKNRLQNEISTNIFLTDNKISVPSILHVSLPRGIVFRQFIEGSIITNIVKESINSEFLPKSSKECYYQLGKFFAKIHDLGIELGDTKPENFIMDDDGQIFALDLEQSKRNGDASWDIAEFLYYSGHYAILPKKGLKKMINNFIDGYLEIGDYNILKKAANLSYVKVFSFWTSPQVMFTISEILRNSVKKSRR
jgi:tRNA A-37 threonylcarbamoyl transferase component Bud32